jgi:hypothetical protein
MTGSSLRINKPILLKAEVIIKYAYYLAAYDSNRFALKSKAQNFGLLSQAYNVKIV